MEKFYDLDGKEVSVKCFRKKTSSAFTGIKHYLYNIVISINGRQIFFKYHDNEKNYYSGIYPDIDDVIKSIIDDGWDYDETRSKNTFANEFNYELDKETVREYNNCRKYFYKLKSVLTNKEINILYDQVYKNVA